MNEFSVKLSEPRRKRTPAGLKPKQTFPVPISKFTNIDASDDSWRWYDAKLNGDVVQVSDKDAIEMLSTLGFFGEIRKEGEEPEGYVAVDDFDPHLPEMSGETVDSDNGEAMTNLDEDGTSSDDPVEEETAEPINPVKSWGSWKSTKIKDDVLILSHFDTFFLAYGLGCLRVTKDNAFMSIDDLWSDFCAKDPNFCHLYAAYHHFRAKNWIVRDGTKFGNDFLLYKDGPPFYHASYSVRVQIGASAMTWTELAALNRVTESAAKELIIVEILEDFSKLKEKMTAPEYFAIVDLREVLVKRWAAAQMRDDNDAI